MAFHARLHIKTRMLPTIHNWYRSTFCQALLGAALLWAALPPLNLAPLAWIAPIFWILLIRAEKLPLLSIRHTPCADGQRHATRRRVPRAEYNRPWLLLLAAALLFGMEMFATDWFHARKFHGYWAAEVVFWSALIALVGRAARRWAAHPYRCLWLAGMIFWLADLHWLRFPYWAIGFGWLALGIYFGLYFPVFVGLSRVGVHRLRLPVALVAPVVWTGLQLAQAHLLSGMTMGCLEHTQYRWTSLIQISDLTGSYGVTFLMMFVAACLARMLPSPFGRGAGGEGKCDGRRWTLWPIVPAAAALTAALVYGEWRISHVEPRPGLKIALIQGNVDVQLHNQEGIRKTTHEEYRRLTREALERFPQADLIVWPETVFSCVFREKDIYGNWVTGDSDARLPADFPNPPDEFFDWLNSWKLGTRAMMTQAAAEFGRPMIVGVDRENYGKRGPEIFNSAVLITPDGQWCHRPGDRYFYDKTHLVPFGEYMPFATLFPWLQYLSPLGSGSSASDRPARFVVKDINLVPNICYETTLPHVIRDQLAALRHDGIQPQVLVNVTNDGWFWGSSELEQHLACGVYRTVENRRPMVIAANTGISASIDGNGHIVERGPKHDTGAILADVQLDGRESWYLRHGDWFAGVCLAGTIALAAVGIYGRLSRRLRGA
jgi:apolipoprotein N-acyltransferase